MDHLGVVGMPECPETQKNFFEAMFRRAAQLPVAAESKKKQTLAPPRLPWSPKCSAVSAVDEDSGTQSDGEQRQRQRRHDGGRFSVLVDSTC